MMQVFEIENFISEEQCTEFLEYVKRNAKAPQGIVIDPVLTRELYVSSKDKLEALGLGITGIYEEITLSVRTKPIGKHYDKKLNNSKYKLLIYLNDVGNGGGTLFFEKGNTLKTQNKARNAVVFDISLQHAGEPSPGGDTKYTIGFRLKTD